MSQARYELSDIHMQMFSFKNTHNSGKRKESLKLYGPTWDSQKYVGNNYSMSYFSD